LFARKPKIAKEFAEKTPKGKKLPEKVGKMAGPLHLIGKADERFSLPMIAVNFTEEPTEYPETDGYENMKPGKGGPIKLPQAGSHQDMVAKRRDGAGPQNYQEQAMPDYAEIYGVGLQESERQAQTQEATRRRAAAAQKTLAYGFHGQPPEPQVLWDPKKELMYAEQIVGERSPKVENTRPNPRGPTYIIRKSLEKGGARGGKYIRRVPKPGGGYRYYYAESAIARGAKAGEEIKLGDRMAKILDVSEDGAVTLIFDGKKTRVKANQWANLLASHYGDQYFKHAEKRALQSVNAVLRHVPRQVLVDLKGKTDKERMKELEKKVPEVYAKLQSSFQRAGVDPFQAKQVLHDVLQRRGWFPEARAAVIGSVIADKSIPHKKLIQTAENLAGGKKVRSNHVAAAESFVKPSRAKAVEREIKTTATAAESEMAQLSSLLAKAQKSKNPEDAAKVLLQAMQSPAMQKLEFMKQAMPGLQDKAVEPVRDTLLEVPSVAPRTTPTTEGAVGTVFVAGEGGEPVAMKAQYKLVEAGDIKASHNASEGFKANPAYPEGVQERAYHRDTAEQTKVTLNAQRLKPEFVINTNPDAVNGPPIISDDGVVLGGNSRTMSMQLAHSDFPDKSSEMKQYLADHAHEVGFKPEDVQAMKNPILVRQVEVADKGKENMQVLVRQMNESFTQGMDPRTMQVAMGRKLTDETLEKLATGMTDEETLSSFLDTPRAKTFIDALYKEGIVDRRNYNQYMVKGTKKLNADGKTLVSRILVGRAIPDADLLSATKPSMINSVARSVPYIAQAASYGKEHDLTDDLKVALDGYNHLSSKVSGGAISAKEMDAKITDHQYQMLMGNFEVLPGLGERHPVMDNKRAQGLLEVLIRRGGPAQMNKVFRDYAKKAKEAPEGQSGLFGEAPSGAELFDEVVQYHLKKSKVFRHTLRK
jgi:hypothetical protein